ncbi:hypothetical protein [Rhodovulum sp.]|uniref:hypothetical protein n=1 Tax=Rhodovulum sp. TaxID=34009 RepID=UPI0017BCEB36|nr:hypothetical protein [Rhodovulum sp.]HDR28349.1 hypothetical protein [Rhodovulum sp.]
MTRLSIATGITQTADMSWLGAGGVLPPLELTLVSGQIEILAATSSTLSLTISGTSAFNGVYQVDPQLLKSGPVNLVRPRITGTAAAGATLTLQPGLWISEKTATVPTESYQWLRNGVVIPDETAPTHVIVPEDGGTVLRVTETVKDANGTRSVQSTTLTVPVLSAPLGVSRIGGFLSSGNASATPSFTVDLSGYAAGDVILFFYGTDNYAQSASVNGVPSQKISTDAGSNGSGRVAAFAHTLTAAGTAASTIAFDLPVRANAHVLSVHGIRNGVVSDVAAVQSSEGGTLTVSATPVSARNAMLACAMGVSFMDGVFTWTGATEIETAVMPTATTRNVSIALQGDVAAGTPHTVTGTPSTANQTGIILVAISEA